MTRYDAPTHWQSRYDHFIGGEYVKPHGGRYFENPTPVTDRPSARSPAAPPRTSRRPSTPRTARPTRGAGPRSPNGR